MSSLERRIDLGVLARFCAYYHVEIRHEYLFRDAPCFEAL